MAGRRIEVAPVGALPVAAATGSARELGPDDPLVVLQYGKWSPLHGVETVLDAAAALDGEPFRFVLVGEGQTSAALRDAVARRRLANVELTGQLPVDALRRPVLEADVCLGVFGASDKAARVIPNKAYDALAAGRPLVTRDSPAARELLADGETRCWSRRPTAPRSRPRCADCATRASAPVWARPAWRSTRALHA